MGDDARVDAMLMEMIRRPIAEPMRSRAIYWLGNTPETQTKNTLFTEIVRNNQESSDARQQAMSALAMSRSAATLPLLQNLFETMTTRELKRSALRGIARNDNADGAATYLIRIAETEKDLELRGPGDLLGTQQSGALDLLIADLGKDGQILQQARECALKMLETDPELTNPANKVVKIQIESTRSNAMNWSRIS